MEKRALAGLWATCALLLVPSISAAAEPDVVLYAADAANLRGNWTRTADPTAAGGQTMTSADRGWSAQSVPAAAPIHSFDFTFNASANTPYHVWMRLRAAGNSKFNDSLYAQFSDAFDGNGVPLYRIGTASALVVNLATSATGYSLRGWGWQDGAYWLHQVATLRFAAGGSHTLRIQTREDGVQIDQVVLSAGTYGSSAPGPVNADTHIVPKSSSPSSPSGPSGPSSPFAISPIALPGTVEAEYFDNGGAGVAYQDASAGNDGGDFRQTDVDVEASPENGFDVGWISAGEWLKYSVNVLSSGAYVLDARVASNGAGGTFHIEFDGKDVTGPLTIPNTGGWQTWTTLSKTVSLSLGSQAMRVVFDTSGPGAVGNLNWVRLSVPLPAPPSAPVGMSPISGAAAVPTTSALAWIGAGATSYDIKLGLSNPPAVVETGLGAPSYTPAALKTSSTYFWQVVARNAGGATAGPVASFTTVPAAPGAPTAPSPQALATGVATGATLSWQATAATSYDVSFGISNPPPQVASGQVNAAYAPGAMTPGATYYWQIVARNAGGSTAGPVWSFTTFALSPTATIVIYASDIPAGARHGSWKVASDSTSPNGVKLTTPDLGVQNLTNALAAPLDYVDVTFDPVADTPYRIWLRLKAQNNNKYNDAVWVQFSNARASNSTAYPINTTTGLLVNLATDAGAASLNGWGWQNTAYWISQATTVTFPSAGTQTMRIQVREDGVDLDQIVLSPVRYLTNPPGPLTSDSTIVSKNEPPVVETVPPPTTPPPTVPPPTYPPLLPPGPTAPGNTWTVAAGGDLQAAIDNAQPGDTLLLEAGATFTGNFVLPAKSGSSFITIRSSAPDSSLPGPAARITPAYAALLPKIKSPNTSPALRTAPGAHHYRLLLLEFPSTFQGYYDIIRLGDASSAQNTMALVPYELFVDRIYVHGDPTYGQKRGIALNSASTSIVNSYIAEIRAIGQDSQAIAGWNGPGPFVITNNYLEAAGENVLFGGADPSIANLVPSDIVITRNHFSKPLAWRADSRWTVKNLLELKNAQRVVIDGNVLENNWLSAQTGYAVLFTPRNQDGSAPWTVVQDVQFTNNVVRHVAAGIQILGVDNLAPSQMTNRIVVRNNLFEDVSGVAYGGQGRWIQMTDGGRDVTVDHNTVLEDGYTVVLVAQPVQNMVFTNNIVPDYSWAIMGDGSSPGNVTIATFFSGSTFTGNIFAGSNPAQYPAGNHYPASLAGVGFVSYAPLNGGNYRLALTSLYRNAGNDGKDVGADFDALNAAVGTSY